MGRRNHLLQGDKLATRNSVAAVGISRADVASYLGTTIETISRLLHYLEDKGVIVVLDNIHFEVLDADRLQNIGVSSNDDLKLFMPAPMAGMTVGRHSEGALVLPLDLAR
jgi:CRP/FNR family transcriptional regulator